MLLEVKKEHARVTDVHDAEGPFRTLRERLNEIGTPTIVTRCPSDEEAQEIVATAALIKGESINLKWKSFNLSLDQWGAELKELVNGLPRQFMLEREISLGVDGANIPIGRGRTHISSARLADPEYVQRELASGSVPPLRLVPGDSDKAQRVWVS